MIKEALEDGWSEEVCLRGYDIFEHGSTGMQEINIIDCVYNNADVPDGMGYEYVTDEDAAYEAERSGFCKIIPVDELPETLERFGLRYFGWVDTPENRAAIHQFCSMENKKKSEPIDYELLKDDFPDIDVDD